MTVSDVGVVVPTTSKPANPPAESKVEDRATPADLSQERKMPETESKRLVVAISATGARTVSEEEAPSESRRRTDLWNRENRTRDKDKELLGLLVKYRDELSGLGHLEGEKKEDMD